MTEPRTFSVRCKNPKCGALLDKIYVDAGLAYHPKCDPSVELDDRNVELKDKLIQLITLVDQNSTRSRQRMIGPSEMGVECDQRLARSIAGLPEINFNWDPWAAIVGTSIHKWLEQAVPDFVRLTNDEWVRFWETEMNVLLDDTVPGHTDIYDRLTGDVIDYKGASPDAIKGYIRGKEPRVSYRVQGHLYGYAHEQAGRKVRDVVLVFLPRQGKLTGIYIHREPYQRDIAQAALERFYRVTNTLIAENIPATGRWDLIEMTPKDCYICPFWRDRPGGTPDGESCPGSAIADLEERQKAADARFARGLLGGAQ